MAGTAAGRSLRSRQLEMNEDYTFAGLMYRRRKLTGEPVSATEKADIKKMADEYAKAKDSADKARTEGEDAADRSASEETLKATIKNLEKELAGRPKFSPEVFKIARAVVSRWKAEAANARTEWHKSFSKVNTIPIPTEMVTYLAKMIRAEVGEFGLNRAETLAKLVAELGDNVKPYFSKAWDKANALIGKEARDPKVKAAIAAAKKGGTSVDVKARAKAESVAGEELSQNTVYDLVVAKLREGMRGEKDIMESVHKDLQEAYPDLTERDVRRAYTEYGKVKFPSKEEVATLQRELRTIVRLQESIDRLQEGKEALHTGQQRDKATQQIREKQKLLNELLKKHKGPPSAEKLASRDEAKQTALRHQIEDLDRQLRTGEKAAERG
jgi:hypothetical protein